MVVVIGVMALDSIKTPFDERKQVLGGGATYTGLSSALLSPTKIISRVGTNFPKAFFETMAIKNVDSTSVQIADGKTFEYECEYDEFLYERKSLRTDLNVLADFEPRLTERHSEEKIIFLSPFDPSKQSRVISEKPKDAMVFLDTIEYYIKNNPVELKKVFSEVDGVFLNEDEARMIAKTPNLLKAGKMIWDLGPRIVVVKKGENGCLLFFNGGVHAFPAYPLEEIVEPTGAGDCFAGGFIGSLERSKCKVDSKTLKKAVGYGTVMGSFVVEKFGVDRLLTLTYEEVKERLQQYREMTSF